MSQRAFVLAPGEVRGPSGEGWSTRLAGVDTAGLVTIGEADLPPMSSGPWLHVHTHEDEVSVVVEGVLTVQLGDQRFEVPAGGIAWLGRGVPHTFANLTTSRVKVIGFITPAGLEGMFEKTAAYLGSLSSPPDPAHIARIGERYGVKSVGPPIQAPPARGDGAGSST